MTVTNPAPTGSASLISRVQGILLAPVAEWNKIEAEPATTQSLFVGYACILALLPAIGLLIGSVVFAHSPLGMAVRLTGGIVLAAVDYALSLAMVYVVSLIINALAPSFGAKPDAVQALKVAVYANTAVWVVGLVSWAPLLGGLLGLAALAYGCYLLYHGVLQVMKPPADKALGYTIVVILAEIGVSFAVFLIIGMVTAMAITGAALTGSGI
jgi:hypothetical protein